MQAALRFSPNLPPSTPTKTSATLPRSSLKIQSAAFSRKSQIKASAQALETSTFDYSSEYSVFPAEACETIGGDACQMGTFPEVKLKPEERETMSRAPQESVDREYLEYNDPKTVFRGEACDDLGGEFCQPGY